MTTFKTEQEAFWAGSFGDEYAGRNQSEVLLAANLSFFSRVLARTGTLSGITEFGANVGMNLKALRLLAPGVPLQAVEINASACLQLRALQGVTVTEGSFLETQPPATDLAFVKGVLIHINPDALQTAYAALDRTAKRWALIAEYYNPTPLSIPYRGHADRLFKRDFAGEFMDRFPTWKLDDYGFLYRRDPLFPQDDISWFLMRRS
jgi:spore coat polysaccharide biosynthesis protein SpsF